MQGHIEVGPRIPGRGQPHDLLLRAGRPGVRGRVRHRRRGHVPGPRPAPAHDRGLALHGARHAQLHVHHDVARARAERARRRAGGARGAAALSEARAGPPALRRPGAGGADRRRSAPLPDAREGRPDARRPLRRARARDRRTAAVGARRTGDLRAADRPLRRAPADAARRSSTTIPKSCAPRRGCRARRSATCARWPSTSSPASSSSSAWTSSPTRT